MRFVFRQSPYEQRLLVKALVVVCVLRLALWVLPFKTLRAIVEKRKSPQNDESQVSFLSVMKIASSVRRAARYVPAASCLTQALATELMLGRMGVNGLLRIGVAKGSEGQLEAHAWVESNGKIIIGKKKDLRRYTVMSHLEEVNQ